MESRATVHLAYGLGETVYHRLASERRPGLITGIQLYPGGYHYLVSWGDRTETRHYELELTTEYVPDYSGA